jgi:hypothetical protein
MMDRQNLSVTLNSSLSPVCTCRHRIALVSRFTKETASAVSLGPCSK